MFPYTFLFKVYNVNMNLTDHVDSGFFLVPYTYVFKLSFAE